MKHKGVPLNRFKVLVMPADLRELSAEQKARLDRFTASGGVIVRGRKSESGTKIAARAEAAPKDRASPSTWSRPAMS